MRRAILLTLAASAVLVAAAPAADNPPMFLGRPMNDWMNDLNSRNPPETRRSAAFALGKIGAEGAPAAIDALTKSLRDDADDNVRDFAAFAVGDVMTALKGQGLAYWATAGPALRQALKDKAPGVRRSAAYALGTFGAVAVPARDDLIAALNDEKPVLRQNAAWALGKLGKEAGPEGVVQLRGLLTDKVPLVRRDAMHALGEVGNPTARAAVSAMMKAAGTETDGVVRKAAVEALSKLVGPDDRADAPSLYPLLSDKDPETRYNAAIVLGMIGGSEALTALPVLRQALKDQDPHFQELAAAAIGGLGPDAAPAVEDLGDALTGAKEPIVRDNAALALSHIGPAAKKALPQLLLALQYADSGPGSQYNSIRPHVAEALADIGFPGNTDALPALLKYIQSDPNPAVRHFCVYAFNKAPDLERCNAVGPLSAVLEETDDDAKMVRYEAARLLAHRLKAKAPAKTADVLVAMLTDANLFIYNGTDTKVKGVGTEGAAGASQTMENLGEDARYMGAEALEWMGAKANRPDVIRALQEAAKDKNAKLSDAAAKALQAIK